MDAGKAVAHQLSVRVVTLPTAASNDAPTSKIYVLYDSDHRLLRVEHLPASPALVVVDTGVIVQAPERLFVAGVGDAIVKKFEVTQCLAAGGSNIFGGRGCQAALACRAACACSRWQLCCSGRASAAGPTWWRERPRTG